jgi:D-alanyl-D-alanine carboxypeptidase
LTIFCRIPNRNAKPVRNALKVMLFAILLVSTSCEGDSRGGAEPGRSPEKTPPSGRDESGDAENGREDDLADALTRLAARSGGSEDFWNRLRLTLDRAEIPEDISIDILSTVTSGPAFILDLLSCLEGDPFLRRLVDKQHALPGRYEPEDLVPLGGGSYGISRRDLRLRKEAAGALEEMAAAAAVEGIVLTVSSSYRSYDYQAEVYARNVKELGREAADRESSRPGFSQHQTGFAADFGSITDAFAETDAGVWMAANAGRFGWSLSFPDGYEDVTGYRWESWHFRYVGKELASFTDAYFGGIQQYALRFIHEWEAGGRTASSAPE